MWSTNSVIDSALGQFFASDFGHGDDYDQLSSENLRSSEIRADASWDVPIRRVTGVPLSFSR